MSIRKILKDSLRRIRENTAIVLVEEAVLPWYYSHTEAANAEACSLHEEVAVKLLEAIVGVVWEYRQSEGDLETQFIVTNVTVANQDNAYVYTVHFTPVGNSDAELDSLPLHAFLQLFMPVGEVTKLLQMHDA